METVLKTNNSSIIRDPLAYWWPFLYSFFFTGKCFVFQHYYQEQYWKFKCVMKKTESISTSFMLFTSSFTVYRSLNLDCVTSDSQISHQGVFAEE